MKTEDISAAIHRMSREDLEVLVMDLIQKRDCDGLNGRFWDGTLHSYHERSIQRILNFFNDKPR